MGTRMERSQKRKQRKKELIKFFFDTINFIIGVIKFIKELTNS